MMKCMWCVLLCMRKCRKKKSKLAWQWLNYSSKSVRSIRVKHIRGDPNFDLNLKNLNAKSIAVAIFDADESLIDVFFWWEFFENRLNEKSISSKWPEKITLVMSCCISSRNQLISVVLNFTFVCNVTKDNCSQWECVSTLHSFASNSETLMNTHKSFPINAHTSLHFQDRYVAQRFFVCQ